LAIQAADLNLKLMKWRMIPDLQIDLLQSRRVLLIGAGTLGCNVARVLVGWGVRKLKFVDYGKVSYSNPVRQPLFTLDDCTSDNGGGRSKAEAAAEALRTVAADVESEGIVLSIPMPGHVEKREAVEESVTQLDALVQEADVIFLLTDTRESRWLPTVMAAAHDKIMINAALGLDSWLVMRHGGGVGEGRLGCYFCNDVVAPENSSKNRTLDQQCTVTRPGLAPIASSMAVEMMVSLLHHPKTVKAPAPAYKSEFSPTVSQDDSSASALGVIPHQVRGSLVSYTMMTPTVPAFTYCTGCAAAVAEAYLKDPAELVFQTCQSIDGSFLESVSGLAAFRADAAEKLGDLDACWDDDEFDDE
jgi:ubiquitin-like modifier-activating enzyme ATG7